MRNDLVERVHCLSLENDQRLQVMDLFGCVSLATAVLRMRRMSRGDCAALNDEIQRILDCGPQVGPRHSDRRTDATLPVGLREWLWLGAGAGPSQPM